MKFVHNRKLIIAASLFTLTFVGYLLNSFAGEKTPTTTKQTVKVNQAFNNRLLEIAGRYKKEYQLIDDSLNWKLVDCVAPSPGPEITISASEDSDTHGRKLYYMFAAQLEPYLKAQQKENPVGQAIVKETWQAKETDPKTPRQWVKHACGKQVSPYASLKEKLYKAGRQEDLYIMFKTKPDTPETDFGWVYGIVSADGKKVVAAGRLQSCMECHQEAGKDRLYGPKNLILLPEINKNRSRTNKQPTAEQP